MDTCQCLGAAGSIFTQVVRFLDDEKPKINDFGLTVDFRRTLIMNKILPLSVTGRPISILRTPSEKNPNKDPKHVTSRSVGSPKWSQNG